MLVAVASPRCPSMTRQSLLAANISKLTPHGVNSPKRYEETVKSELRQGTVNRNGKKEFVIESPYEGRTIRLRHYVSRQDRCITSDIALLRFRERS